jgi:hypothetical protein
MVMTQLSLKIALKQWGEDTKVAVKQSSSTGTNSFNQFTGRRSTRRSGSKSLSRTYLLRRSTQAKSRPARLQEATSRETSPVRRMRAPLQ